MISSEDKPLIITPTYKPIKRVYVINGFGGCGKDSFCNSIIRLADAWAFDKTTSSRNAAVYNYSTIDPVREMLTSFGIDVTDKTPALRNLLANIKHELEEFDWALTRKCVDDVTALLNLNIPTRNIVFVHCREQAGIMKIKQLLESKVHVSTILMRRPGVAAAASNAADQNVENMAYDIEIDNNGTVADLTTLAGRFLDDILSDETKNLYYAAGFEKHELAKVIQAKIRERELTPIDIDDAEEIAEGVLQYIKDNKLSL